MSEAVLGTILPTGVAAEELFEDPPGLEPHPREAHLIEKAVDKRKREFTSARHCARLALGRLGLDPAPILRGDMGSPVWPNGVVGSLTHCDGYRAKTKCQLDREGIQTVSVEEKDTYKKNYQRG